MMTWKERKRQDFPFIPCKIPDAEDDDMLPTTCEDTALMPWITESERETQSTGRGLFVCLQNKPWTLKKQAMSGLSTYVDRRLGLWC